jgi:hypothetical protein
MVGEQKATTKTTVTRKFLDPVKVSAELGMRRSICVT